MKAVLSSNNASYDEVSKKYTFAFRNPLSNINYFKILDCSFVLENHTISPAQVFLRSPEILNNTTSGTVREARNGANDGLDHHSDIICMLTENAQSFRYNLKQSVTFRLRKNNYINQLTFYFTDSQGNVLDMRATQNNVASASDSQVEAIDDLIFWTDMSKANKLLNVNNAPVPIEADQNVNYILDRKSTTLVHALQYGTHCTTCLVGQTIGVTRGENIGWQSFFDSTAWVAGNQTLNDVFHFHILINFPDSSAHCQVFLSEFLYIVLYQGSLCIILNGNDYTNTANVQLLQNVPYVMSFQRVHGGNTWNFDVRVEPAGEDTYEQGVQTDTVEATSQSILDTEAWNNIRIGAPNTHFSQQSSHMLLVNGNTQSDYETCIGWLKAKAQGTEIAETPTGTESHFSLFAELR
jgi:hypothetical protein